MHYAVRGTIARVVIKEVAAKTYFQAWWPQFDTMVYSVDRPPCGTTNQSPMWTPRLVRCCRPSARSSPRSARTRNPPTWACKGKVHQPATLGYTGRRCLVSRNWSTLTDHRLDGQAWLRAIVTGQLGDESTVDGNDEHRYYYELAGRNDLDVPPSRNASSTPSPPGSEPGKQSRPHETANAVRCSGNRLRTCGCGVMQLLSSPADGLSKVVGRPLGTPEKQEETNVSTHCRTAGLPARGGCGALAERGQVHVVRPDPIGSAEIDQDRSSAGAAVGARCADRRPRRGGVMAKRRANGEGTVYQRKDGRSEGAAYVLTPDGTRKRVRVYGSTWDEAAKKRADLLANDRNGIPAEAGDKVREYLAG